MAALTASTNKSSDERAGAEFAIASDADVVRVRQAARALAIKVALSIVDQTKFVTAASELARNTLVHGGGGSAVLEILEADGRRGVRAVFADSGPGIADLDVALAGGYSSKNGLGLGLSGSRRLVDAFEIETQVGNGTRVTVIKWGR